MHVLMLKDHSGYKAGETVEVGGGVLEMILEEGAGVKVEAPPVVEALAPQQAKASKEKAKK